MSGHANCACAPAAWRGSQSGYLLIETAAVLAAVAIMLAYGASVWMERQERARISQDYAAVEAAARAFARHRCNSLPATAVSLANVLTEVGRAINVQDQSLWSVSMSAGPNGSAALLSIRYATLRTTSQAAILLEKQGAEWNSGFVVVPVNRQLPVGQTSSFQSLFEDGAC